jgi:uncharacterized protein (DUF2267 family)
MSSTGLDVFDKTLQTTHVWLMSLRRDWPRRSPRVAVLGAVLRATRDRLPMDLAAHFGSQLPLLVRGTYYDRLRPSELPSKLRSLDEFLNGIEAELAMNRPVNSRDATRAVFQILSRHVNRGQIEKVRQALPEDVRAIWHDDPNAPDVRKRPQRYARAGNRRTDPKPMRGKPTTKPEKGASRGKHGGKPRRSWRQNQHETETQQSGRRQRSDAARRPS